MSETSNSRYNIFEFENRSVDLLLEELNIDLIKVNDENIDDQNLNNHEKTNQEANHSFSPTKPLNFPKSLYKSTNEANSSSDTYISDHEQTYASEKLIEKNFDFENSFDIQKTIHNHPQSSSTHENHDSNNDNSDNSDDEFSFQTPTTSTTDLLHQRKQQLQQLSSSPNKSSMKNQTKSSPKKSVVFTQSNPEIHHYNDTSVESDDNQVDEQAVAEAISIHHNWQIPKLSSQIDDNSNSMVSTPPPPPPPHTSKSKFSELLNTNQSEEDKRPNLTMKQSNFSNLSLSEKLDLYLDNQPINRQSEMDSHLQLLNDSYKEKINDDIHDLSYSLQTPRFKIMENPLSSLTKDSDHQELRSSGSSSSSLQSLRDDNRQLSSVPGSPTKLNRGLELNDGIKGLSDDIVEKLLPQDESNEEISTTKVFVKREFDDDELQNSFDRSYNNTEQSILNLLNNVSNTQVAPSKEVKQEDDPFSDSIKVVVSKPMVKSEFSQSENDMDMNQDPIIEPKEEINQIPISNDEDESETSRNSTKLSIRFHVDDDWKLEDSHDGDKEDNDGDYSKIDKSIANETEYNHSLTPQSACEQSNKSDQDNVLANSSNIVAADVTLPPVETNNYSSFEDITRNLENSVYSSFEESLSAEHDQVGKHSNQIDFISIWHTQEKMKKRQIHKVPTKQIIADVQNEQFEKVRIPSSLIQNQKSFKEVNLVSRKILNSNVIDELDISQFLPELSQDSGFDNLQFSNQTTLEQINNESKTNTHNVLTPIDNNRLKSQPMYPKTLPELHIRRASVNQITTPQPQQELKKSRFRVPTFEIKRSNSILSPKNMYNEIFEDIIPPTIKSKGMKTLPSMDKDDVKRILDSQKGLTQEEYSNIKFKNHIFKKNSVVNEPNEQFDKLQQAASLHDAATFESSPLPKNKSQVKENESNNFKELSENQSPTSHTVDNVNELVTDFVDSPNGKVHDSPEKLVETALLLTNNEDLSHQPSTPNKRSNHQPSTPNKKPIGTRNSPIKIGSPVKLIKNNGSVVGVESPRGRVVHKSSSFEGNELNNNKIRDANTVNTEQQNVPSTVSVPSEFSIPNHHRKTRSDPKILEENHPVNIPQERGKLFFRVVGFKNILLPDIKDHKGKFSITLDNGVHCVKTPDYELSTNSIKIDKEFELTVNDKLEFILTMKMNYQKPRGTLVEVKERKLVKSKNRFSRLFGSKDLITTTRFVPQDVKDTWANKFAVDGSFARCCIDLSNFESMVTGKAQSFDLNCFNEWEVNKYTQNNGQNSTTRLQPYKIAQLEVKMLYIPRTDQYEMLPTSIRSANEQLEQLLHENSVYYEGYLHQEGGDCQTWKRRFFKLFGTSLIAHSEFNHKTRAKINLSKIVDVSYIDKENYKSAGKEKIRNFSDILLMENSFRIKFINGETIEFGAPNKTELNQWIQLLESIVYRNRFRRQPWVKLMMENVA